MRFQSGPRGSIPQGALFSAGWARAGLPHLQTCIPGPWDHPADSDAPGASPAERGPQNLLPEERASHHPQVHPEGRMHSGGALRRWCPAVWDAVWSSCPCGLTYLGAEHSWTQSFRSRSPKKEAQGLVMRIPSSAEGGSEMLSLSCKWETGV